MYIVRLREVFEPHLNIYSFRLLVHHVKRTQSPISFRAFMGYPGIILIMSFEHRVFEIITILITMKHTYLCMMTCYQINLSFWQSFVYQQVKQLPSAIQVQISIVSLSGLSTLKHILRINHFAEHINTVKSLTKKYPKKCDQL